MPLASNVLDHDQVLSFKENGNKFKIIYRKIFIFTIFSLSIKIIQMIVWIIIIQTIKRWETIKDFRLYFKSPNNNI